MLHMQDGKCRLKIPVHHPHNQNAGRPLHSRVEEDVEVQTSDKH